jgi:Chitin synthase N-terminal
MSGFSLRFYYDYALTYVRVRPSHMRYSAAIWVLNEFMEENGWSLRTRMYNHATELIAVTYVKDKMLWPIGSMHKTV